MNGNGLKINEINDLLTKDEYGEYLDSWWEGVFHEAQYWWNQLDKMPHEYWIKKRGYSPYDYETEFKYDEYVEPSWEECKFLDVGSGPVSDCGSVSEKTKLHVFAVDPLANIYNEMKQRKGFTNAIQVEFCTTEFLSEKFTAETFDIVHMRNALDHSFNPFIGLAQMLFITKIGGRVILSHFDNEAEHEKYEGFHQWNLEIKNNVFYIWKKDVRINVNELLHGLVKIDGFHHKFNDFEGRVFHTVIIDKMKESPKISDPLGFVFMEKCFNYIAKCTMDDVLSYYNATNRLKRKLKNLLR